MIQEIIVYILLGAACSYVAYRIYCRTKKKKACDNCALMNAAKSAQKK